MPEVGLVSKWIRVEGAGVETRIFVGEPNPPLTAEDEDAALNDAITQAVEYLNSLYKPASVVFEPPEAVRE